MRARIELALCGAAGVALAALLYWLALWAQGALSFLLLISGAGFVIFWMLLLVSLAELFVMTIGLRRLAARWPVRFLCLIAVGYVGFVGVYALLYALFVPDLRGIQILAALSLARWLTLWLIIPVAQTK